MKLPLTTKVFTLLVIIILLAIGYVVGITRRPTSAPPPPPTSRESPPPTQGLSPQQILTLLQSEFSVTRELVTMHRDWQSATLSRRVPLTGQYFGLDAADTPALSGHTVPPTSGGTTYEIRGSGMTILKEKIAAFFADHGFVANTQNSARDEASYSLDETLSFEKGDVACLVTLRTLDPVAAVFCGTVDLAYETLRNEFISVFNPSRDPEVFVEVTKVEGNFASGGTGGRGGGVGWYAVKEAGVWKSIFQGQNSPPCSVMEQYRFPKRLYEECDPGR